ncbi:MAG: 6-phosphofructokinase [Elusimicrobiota bacterium]|jgi:6-phosphofructokinase 1|nr:6-phosphofructokinase [Elusimicrobiota bacterium]
MSKKLAVITSGGDAPGMNAAVRAIVRRGVGLGYDMIGIRRGFRGLLEDDFVTLTTRSVSRIINLGGTILHTGRCPEMKTETGLNRAVRMIKELNVDGIVVIGGDGSLAAGNALSKSGVKVINIPASIDNDIYGTDETIGYDTALNTAVDAIDNIRDTATSHDRIFVVEIMGREHGFLTLDVGLAAGCEFVVVPEMPLNVEEIASELQKGKEKGKTSEIVAFAEGAGSSEEFAAKIAQLTGLEVRVSILGYIQRGGRPTARTRILASQFGSLAVELLDAGQSNLLVCLEDGKIISRPISEAIAGHKQLNKMQCELINKLSV